MVPIVLVSRGSREGSGDAANSRDALIRNSLSPRRTHNRPVSEDVTLSLLGRAKAAGYTALVVTLDTFSLGYRPKDLEAAYLPFLHGQGLQNLFSDPVFMGKLGEDHRDPKWNGPGEVPIGVEAQVRDPDQLERLIQVSMAALGETNSGHYFTWKDVAFLRKNWDGPLILKGIQTLEDAHKAIEARVDGIVVSNHGGRQVNGALPSLHALEEIGKCPKVKDAGLTILFDSGVRTGADVVKALARELTEQAERSAIHVSIICANSPSCCATFIAPQSARKRCCSAGHGCGVLPWVDRMGWSTSSRASLQIWRLQWL